MSITIIKNALIVNEGTQRKGHVRIKDDRIDAIRYDQPFNEDNAKRVIDANGKALFPGIIDGQVHFRDPGLTHKADLNSESKAAVAGGVTSFFDMPNTKPNTLTMAEVEEKNRIASEKSVANYFFPLGVSADNVDEVVKLDTSKMPMITDDGLYFSGKGNIVADSPETLDKIFSGTDTMLAIHSELEEIIEKNENEYREKYGEDVPVKYHPIIRSAEGCYASTKRAIELARKHDARLHILHLSTAMETDLFTNEIPLEEKKITTEVSVHHIWFTDKDYERLGKKIKWNPAVKTQADKEGLFAALLDDRIDIITTDHAPHTWEEKDKPYFSSMSGAPLVQHSLVTLLEYYHEGKINLPKIAQKMAHNVAILYGINERGFIREGYKADLTLVDLNQPWTVDQSNILYKCGWSPLEGQEFKSKVTHTWVNGALAYENGKLIEKPVGEQLAFTPRKFKD
jgi:dihydroorotase